MDVSITNVILIDDEPALLDISKQFLELDENISVDTSTSAAEALKLIKVKAYDVIVSDYQMPCKDGIQLLKDIREMENRTPFILFTGKGREDVAIEALNSGADFYLQKGGEPRAQFAELRNMIKKSVEKCHMELSNKENEEKFRNIFNSTNDLIHIVDLDGQILEINDIGCRLLGYTKQEILQMNVREIDSHKHSWQVPDRMKEVIETESALFETEWVTKNGKIIPMELNIRRINYSGRPAFLSVARDITERKRNKETLIHNDDRISSLNRMLTMLSQTNRMLMRAQSPREIFHMICTIAIQYGGFEHAWIGKMDHGSVAIIASTSKSEKGLLPRIGEVMESEKLALSTASCKNIAYLTGQLQGDAKSDSPADIISGSILILPIKSRNEPPAFLGIHASEEYFFSKAEVAVLEEMVKDVSFAWDSLLEDDRGRGEQEIQGLERTIDSAYDAVIGKDLNGIVTRWNGGAERVCGYTKDEMVGRSISLLAAPDSKDDIQGIIVKILRGEVIDHHETIRLTKDGRRINVTITVSPVFDDQGYIIGVSTVASDITDRRTGTPRSDDPGTDKNLISKDGKIRK
jgi:PAS domain S-box-containing protein